MYADNQLKLKLKLTVSIFIVAVILSFSSNLALALRHEGSNASSNLQTTGANSSLIHLSESDRISLTKRKQTVFNLIDKLNKMSNPNKESLEALFKRELKSKRLGFYESDVQPEIDMKSFQVSYGRNNEIVCANIYLQQNLNLQLADAKKHFGNYQTKFSDSLFIDNKNFPVVVYLFNKKGKKVYFSFLKKKSQAVEIHVSFE